MADHEEKNEKESGDKRWWADAMREMTATGLATFFMTEDSVRNYLKEKKLPKEFLGLFLDGVGKKKDDFYAMLAKECGRVLAKVDVSREVARFLEKHKIHLEAKISFEPKPAEKTDTENKTEKGTP